MTASRSSRPVREVLLEGPESDPEECGEAEMCQLERCVKALQFHSQAQKDRRNRVAQGPRAAVACRRGTSGFASVIRNCHWCKYPESTKQRGVGDLGTQGRFTMFI